MNDLIVQVFPNPCSSGIRALSLRPFSDADLKDSLRRRPNALLFDSLISG